MRRSAVDIIATLAGIAQLVERNLAKVEVASSRLVSRSRLQGKAALAFPFSSQRSKAGWQSGHAAACKAVDAGSIPTPASKPYRFKSCTERKRRTSACAPSGVSSQVRSAALITEALAASARAGAGARPGAWA